MFIIHPNCLKPFLQILIEILVFKKSLNIIIYLYDNIIINIKKTKLIL